MKFLGQSFDFDNTGRGINSPDPLASQDLATKNYVDGSSVAINTATHTVASTTTFLRGFGTTAIAVTVPASRTRQLTIKHVGTQDLTITMQSGQVDGNANVILRGGKKQSVTLAFEGGNAWII